MKRKTVKKKSRKTDVINYVMFGFKKNDVDDTGYLGRQLKSGEINIVQDIHDAQLFPDKNVKKIRGFGTPEQWLNFWNNSDDNPYIFHLVKTCL